MTNLIEKNFVDGSTPTCRVVRAAAESPGRHGHFLFRGLRAYAPWIAHPVEFIGARNPCSASPIGDSPATIEQSSSTRKWRQA
jgi:hypothetical protein